MAHPLRNLFLHWHRLRKTRVHVLDGIRISTDPAVAPAPVRNGLFKNVYEDAERALLKACVKPGDKVLEIGGGIGLVGLLAAKMAGAGQVTSYEANPALKSVIEANYALNPVRPELRMKAITADGAPATFHVSDNVVSSSLLERAEASREVTVDSDALDAVLAELRPDVLIMDVEGAEIDLLPSADLGCLRALVVEMHPHVTGAAAVDTLMDHLRGQGFSLSVKARTNVLMERT